MERITLRCHYLNWCQLLLAGFKICHHWRDSNAFSKFLELAGVNGEAYWLSKMLLMMPIECSQISNILSIWILNNNATSPFLWNYMGCSQGGPMSKICSWNYVHVGNSFLKSKPGWWNSFVVLADVLETGKALGIEFLFCFIGGTVGMVSTVLVVGLIRTYSGTLGVGWGSVEFSFSLLSLAGWSCCFPWSIHQFLIVLLCRNLVLCISLESQLLPIVWN